MNVKVIKITTPSNVVYYCLAHQESDFKPEVAKREELTMTYEEYNRIPTTHDGSRAFS